MSRFCIRIRPSRRREYITWALIVASGGAALVLAGRGHVWLLPLLLTLISALLFSLHSGQVDDQLSITEHGEGRWANDQSACQLLPGSLLTPFLLALRLSAAQSAVWSSQSQWQLVFKDQTTARGWRRLRRIALNVSH